MNDPHVETLTYEFRVVTGGHHFANANAWCGRLGDFDCVLEHAILTARPTTHYATAAEARDALEPLLRGWEAQIELERAYQAEFNFASATVVDRNPPRGGQTRELQATVTGRPTISADVSVEHGYYPSPPEDRLTESDKSRHSIPSCKLKLNHSTTAASPPGTEVPKPIYLSPRQRAAGP